MKKTTDSYIDQIPDVINGLKAEKWLRGHAITSQISMRFMPQANKRYRDTIRELSEDEWECYFASLSSAYARSKAQSDFMGVIAIPLVLGLVTSYVTLDVEATIALLFIAFIVVYFFVYFHYRTLVACLEPLLATAKLVRGVS